MARFLDEKRKDRLAAAVIRGGGLLVILVVIAIVVDIGWQAVPLFTAAEVGPAQIRATAGDALLVWSNLRGDVVWELARDGRVRFPGEPNRAPLAVFPQPARLVAADLEIHGLVSALADDGRVAVGEVRMLDRWVEGARTVRARWRPAAEEPPETPSGRWIGVTANRNEDGDVLLLVWGEAGAVALRYSADDEEWSAPATLTSAPVAHAAVAQDLRHVALVGRHGELEVVEPDGEKVETHGPAGPVTAVRFLIGGGTLVAGAAGGTPAVLLFVPRIRVINRGARPLGIEGRSIAPGASLVLPDDELGSRLASQQSVGLEAVPPAVQVVRTLPPLGEPITRIEPSHRRRGFLAVGEGGMAGLYHATSGRRLAHGRWIEDRPQAVALAPKGDALLVAAGGSMTSRTVHNPHPEVSLRTLFLPVQYEGYARPRLVWQSTGGSDAFEAKLSLVPLIFGTLKATLYAMLFSVPLAVLAALYVAQLGPAWLRPVVKPAVELMAAVPSVVVGFLAALWLAPRLERALFLCLSAAVVLPLAIAVAAGLWRLIPAGWKERLRPGNELVLMVVACVLVVGTVALGAGPLERALFGGDFPRWLFTEWGLRYDQRNALVVGLALGFAVIPVIFTLAEDAFSAVPASLVNASRALGATPWQTARSLVIPAASAGVFAAIVLGLGRAVGETMIVLMAAGNTPLLDLSPFNGMRTMSAAIAVEIPEAPVGGSLYRVLFLTGFLLFLFTLVSTSIADLVGSRLRKRYGRF